MIPVLAPSARFLVIRRDNIGDLVCTTPLLRLLRQRFPTARIDMLVNSYNEPVVENNPDVSHVYAYTKAKHRPAGRSVLGVFWDRFKLLRHLRAQHYDFAIVAGSHFLPKPLSLARQVKPRRIVGFVGGDHPAAAHVDVAVPCFEPRPVHQVEAMAPLLGPFGIVGPMPQMLVVPEPAAAASAQRTLAALGWQAGSPTLAVHISARKPRQRWPEENFAVLMAELHRRHRLQFVLFWSPGDEDNPLHPGDDRKAARIIEATKGLPVYPFPTGTLKELIAGLSLCQRTVCSDGGAMHIAAALGKPIVCFFGNSDASVWYPWGVPHRLLQKPTADVKDIGVDEALAAYEELAATTAG
jgi:ADP-heptose:LPS heptosyltransferase